MDKNIQITEILSGLRSGYYGIKEPLDEFSMSIYLQSLAPFPADEIRKAITKHISTPVDGNFFPKVSHIVKHIGVRAERDYNWQDVIEGARKPRTPCDVLARIHIKSHYLNSYENMSIKHRADTFLDNLEENRARAMVGEYTEHEIVTMISHGVKVSSPFMIGMDGIGSNQALRLRYNQAIQSPLHIENVARIESRERNGLPNNLEGQKKVLSELKGLLSVDDRPQKDIDSDDAVYKKLMNKAGE